MWKKVVSFLVGGMLLLSVMGGCGNTATDSANENNSTATTNKQAPLTKEEVGNGELTLPITSEPVTLKFFVHTRLGVDDFENNEFTKWVQEQTGVQLDFVVAPEQSALDKLNVLMASGDYPDIITGNQAMPAAQIKLYGEQGIFIPLNDLIDKYGVNTKKMLEEYPPAADIITMPDGKIYALPDINDCYHCSMSNKMWVYQPWLDQLGLKVPETTDEFKAMLQAFKNDDPNGNGQKDEIPMMGANNGGWNAFPEYFLMNSFVYYDRQYGGGLYIDNGKVTPSYTSPEWKEGLKYLNSLVQEGVLAPETYTQDNSILIQNAENATPIVGAVPSGYMGMFCQITASDRWKDFVAISPVEGPEGVRYTQWSPYNGAVMRYMITNNCKNPEVAFKLGDFFYTEEATHRSCDGPEGVGFAYLEPDSGKVGINGKPAAYELLMGIDNLPPNSSWNQSTIGLRTAEYRTSAALTDSALFEGPLHQMTETNYAPYQPSKDMPIPPLFFTDEQANELLIIENTITTYLKEKNAGYITGAIDINETWDGYLEELDAMGLPKMIEIYQAAVEAK